MQNCFPLSMLILTLIFKRVNSMRHKRKYINQNVRNQVFKRYEGHCAYCGCELNKDEMVIDHFFPVSRWKRAHREGEVDDVLNLMPSCKSCNYWKGAKSPGGFRNFLAKQFDTVYKESAGFRNLLRYGQVYPSIHKSIRFYYQKHCESPEWCEGTGFSPKIQPFYKNCEPVTPDARYEKKEDEDIGES